MFDILDLQKKVVAAVGPSGHEQAVGQVFAELARPFVDEIKVDDMYNVICHKKPSGNNPNPARVMLAGHMDAIGIYIKSIDEKGFLWIDRVGGLNPATLLNKPVRFIRTGVLGAVRAVGTADVNKLTYNDVYCDIGAKDREDALKMVQLGDTAVFDQEPVEIAGGCITTPYADDLIAGITMLLTMEQMKDSENDIYYVFTTQEVVGCRGALNAAYGVDPDYGVAIDVNPIGDTPTQNPHASELGLFKGPAITKRDGSHIANLEIVDLFTKAAEENGIPYQYALFSAGGTDASSIQKSHDGVKATCIGIPTRHIHTPCETYNTDDVKNAARLLAAFLSKKL